MILPDHCWYARAVATRDSSRLRNAKTNWQKHLRKNPTQNLQLSNRQTATSRALPISSPASKSQWSPQSSFQATQARFADSGSVKKTSLEIAEVVSTSVAVSAGTIESTKIEFMQPWMILELSLRPEKFPIEFSQRMPTKTCNRQTGCLSIQDMSHPTPLHSIFGRVGATKLGNGTQSDTIGYVF